MFWNLLFQHLGRVQGRLCVQGSELLVALFLGAAWVDAEGAGRSTGSWELWKLRVSLQEPSSAGTTGSRDPT